MPRQEAHQTCPDAPRSLGDSVDLWPPILIIIVIALRPFCGLGRSRVVARLPRLRVRYEQHADVFQGLLQLACTLICLRFLDPADGP